MIIASNQPWFSDWNYGLLTWLSRYLPHSNTTDDLAVFLIFNPIISSWIFAACFYLLWTKNDDQQVRRRQYLIASFIAFCISCLVTLVVRPWIHWPAPVVNGHFRHLFPSYFWAYGNYNSFPSHSTLAYFGVAVGLWPLNRRLSTFLAGFVLLFISLPRVYAGGHYPIDVLFSCVLAIVTLLAVWRWAPIEGLQSRWLNDQKSFREVPNLLFFLWLFELGEGFRGLEFLAGVGRRLYMH